MNIKNKFLINFFIIFFCFNVNAENNNYYINFNVKKSEVVILKNNDNDNNQNVNLIKRIEFKIVGDREVLMRDTSIFYKDGSQYIPSEFNNNIDGYLSSSTIDGSLILNATVAYPSSSYTPKNLFTSISSWYSTANLGTLNMIFSVPQDIGKIKTKNAGSIHLAYSSSAYCGNVSVSIFNSKDDQIGETIFIPKQICNNTAGYTIDFITSSAY